MADTNPLGGRPYGDQSSSFANNLYLLGENQNQQKFTGQTGNANVTTAQNNLGSAANYDLNILSGDRSQILAAEAPEVGSILHSYDTARRAAAELSPRGGGRSELLNELPYKEAGDINKLIQGARPAAAANLAGVAGAQGNLGVAEQGVASSNVQNSLNFLLGKSGAQLNWAQFNGEQGQQTGQALGQVAAQLLQAAAIAAA